MTVLLLWLGFLELGNNLRVMHETCILRSFLYEHLGLSSLIGHTCVHTQVGGAWMGSDTDLARCRILLLLFCFLLVST